MPLSRRRSHAILTLACWCSLLPAAPAAPAALPPAACRAHETALIVNPSAHVLTLCRDGRAAASHRVALGAGGLGKRRQGDQKTPLGRYDLGRPRPSRDYGTFIPIGYPTPQQRRLGFTGSAVGIHGPPRHLSGGMSTWADWTAGCVAVGSDAEIATIAAFVRTARVKTVRIE